MAYGHEQIYTVTQAIEVDPAGAESFHMMRAPRAITVVEAYAVAEVAQNAGTAVTLTLENWGTAGTAVAGTIVPALGGTATAARLGALAPAAGTPDSTEKFVDEGEWLVLTYGEEGAGWVAGDRFVYTVNYRIGKG